LLNFELNGKTILLGVWVMDMAFRGQGLKLINYDQNNLLRRWELGGRSIPAAEVE
jgi:hypothetical protein